MYLKMEERVGGTKRRRSNDAAEKDECTEDMNNKPNSNAAVKDMQDCASCPGKRGRHAAVTDLRTTLSREEYALGRVHMSNVG
mmetsp:Transcript_28475/g.36746  ORF Transcript_28475/g.36746 Transcript_28475/m.36746 type:complete len:83 (+) Transcript_28475:99-347(+)